MKVGAVVLVCLAVAGCGIARQKEEKAAWDRAKAEGEACAAQYAKFTMNWAKCVNDAQAKVSPYLRGASDFGNVLATSRVALSERVSSGKMTVAEADFALAQIGMTGINQLSARESSARIAAAAEASNDPVTCNRFGTTVTCF